MSIHSLLVPPELEGWDAVKYELEKGGEMNDKKRHTFVLRNGENLDIPCLGLHLEVVDTNGGELVISSVPGHTLKSVREFSNEETTLCVWTQLKEEGR